MNRAKISTLGLIFITFLSAIQYIFLQNVPDTVSTFSFLCITNLIGLVILGCTQLKKIFTLPVRTLKEGALFAIELTGFNFFLLMGSRNMDSVIISSVVSMYFIFITPLLLLLKKRVNFFSGIATVIAIIALILMFGADTDAIFGSLNVIYLILADLFFASYVVSVSILGDGEDSMQLTISQMIFASIFCLIGWVIESVAGQASFGFPTDARFWISACFIGIFIRAIYGLVQISAQKYVPAINASLIFSSEIIITLVLNPFLCSVFHTTYVPATIYQIVGCILFIIATLMVDDSIMSRLGFSDVDIQEIVNEKGEVELRSSVSRKMIFTTLMFTMLTLILSMVVCLSAIHFIRDSAVEHSTSLGEDASATSANALTEELETKMQQIAEDKAKLAEAKLDTYAVATQYAAAYATSLYADSESYPAREVQRPLKENAGIWTMQRCLADESYDYKYFEKEAKLLGNMKDSFAPIIEKNDNIATIYLGTESGLLISYDQNSDSGTDEGESYYEYRSSIWYELGKNADGYTFTDTYQDSYGRGLTITCVSPFYDKDGTFAGCIAMDILMNDLNETMVSDGIIDPSVATLIDNEGNIIASKDVDPNSETVYNIFDKDADSYLKKVGKEIIEKKDGITSTSEGEDAIYIAYSTIDSTEWILCIISPASTVLEPAVMIRDSIDENTVHVIESVVQGIFTVVQNCLVLSAVILLCVTFFIGKFSRRISDPLKKLETDVQKISQGNFDQRTEVDTDDEIGSLARTFNMMTDSLQKYIVDLKEVTAKEERIASELSVAAKIQASMLPNNFPAFPGRKDFDIFATMRPAKEVGGDFYDFFLVDDTHLALVMADVSGKGVPAALFMVIAKTMIKNRVQMGGTPAEVLTDVNQQLCEGNDEGLFVTVWLAILDLTTGKGLESNAGHEHPVIRRKNGSYELIKYRHSPAIATIEGIRFRNVEFELNHGDRLFVYTDGVPEATSDVNEMFGTDRMLASLNARNGCSLQEILAGVQEDIDLFANGAEQFDDVTMLGFDYFGT